jgi:hypothetical protein
MNFIICKKQASRNEYFYSLIFSPNHIQKMKSFSHIVENSGGNIRNLEAIFLSCIIFLTIFVQGDKHEA